MNSSVRTRRPLRYVASTNIKERNLAFFDLEFSGFELDNDILEIGCVLVSQPDFKVIREWQTKIKPGHTRNRDKKTLKLIGYSAEKWKDAIPARRALEEFNTMVEDAVLVGYNMAWDFFLLKKSLSEKEIKPLFHWQVLDVLSMLYAGLYNKNINGFRMREMARYFKIKNGTWHDALADAKLTYELFLKLI